LSLFGSAFQKVERANQHILDLETAFNAHREGHGYYLRSELDADGTTIFYIDFFPSLPPGVPLLIGDAIHNLRSALDHATWELLGLDGGTQDGCAFPCCKGSVADYEGMCKGIQTPRGDTKKFFMNFSAYPGGKGEDVLRLHQLNIIDKHRTLMPIIHIASLDDLKVTRPNGQIGRLSVNQFRQGPCNTFRLMVDKGGEKLNIEADQETGPNVDIFFNEVAFFKHMPIIGVLQHLSITVERCLWQFRDFVSQRDANSSSDLGIS
jgi:hypothetical protein